jgi:hypothetical protein
MAFRDSLVQRLEAAFRHWKKGVVSRSLFCSLSCTRSQDERFLLLSDGRRAGLVSIGETKTGIREREIRREA